MKLIDKSALVAEIKRRMDENRGKQTLPQYFGMVEEDLSILSFIDSMQEEPVSEELEDAAFDYAEACKYKGGEKLLCVEHFKTGVRWERKRYAEQCKANNC